MFYQIITQTDIYIPVLIFTTGVLTDCNKSEIFMWGKLLRVITMWKTTLQKLQPWENSCISPKPNRIFFKFLYLQFCSEWSREGKLFTCCHWVSLSRAINWEFVALEPVSGIPSSDLERNQASHALGEGSNHWSDHLKCLLPKYTEEQRDL